MAQLHKSAISLTLWAITLLILPGLRCAVAAPGSLRFEQVSVEQGLAQESVLSILQDRQGLMWFGTQAGLSRYDGYRMTVYKSDPSDPNSLVDNYVISSYQDEQGRLWFGSKGGLNLYDPRRQQFTRYLADPQQGGSVANRAIYKISGDEQQGLWLATADGLKHFDPATGQFQAYRHDGADPGSIASDKVTTLARDRNGDLWIAHFRGIDRLARGAKVFQHFPLQARSTGVQRTVLSLALSPRRVLWIGTDAGLEAWQLGGDQPQRLDLPGAAGLADLANARIISLYLDQDERLWIGTNSDGLKNFDPGSARLLHYRHEPLDRHSLGDNQISALYQDRTGVLWVGSWHAGVYRTDLASGGFERYSELPGALASISNNKVRSMTGDSHGRVWIGTSGGGLNLLDPGSGQLRYWRHDPKQPGSLPDDQVSALALDARGRLWLGTQRGLSWYDAASGRFTNQPLGELANSNFIQRIYQTRAGLLWIATRAGLYQLDPASGAWQSYRHDSNNPHSLATDWVNTLLEDRNGALWIGTDNGLDRFEPGSGRFIHYRHDAQNPNSIAHDRVHYLMEDSRGRLWIGTAGGVSQLLRQGAAVGFRSYAAAKGRAADPVGAILEDRDGLLWVSTTAGISRFNPEEGSYKHYAPKDGLINGSYFVGSGYGSADGTLYFGGMNGVTAFRPENIHDNRYAPTVLITDFSIFNQSLREHKTDSGVALPDAIENTRSLTLSHRDSVFALEFAAQHYADPQRNLYAYQLQGFDRDWVLTDASKRYVTYTNLYPGDYLFRVKAANKDGVWSDAPATLAIHITPPFWQTWWFLLLTLGTLGGAVYASYHLRIRSLLAQRQLLEQQVGARTGELLLQKTSLEQQKHEAERQKENVELAHRNISLLSEIGRKITSTLDSEAIMLTLYQHVNELMDASVFGIGFYRPEQELIEYPFALEQGKRYAPYTRSMHEPNQLAVWCIQHQSEVFINDLEHEYQHYIGHLELTSGAEHMGTLADGSKPTEPRSLLYVPISANGRILGVISVHSYHVDAYQRFHLDMLRTLASYVGVALDNAHAYRQLQDTQQQLVASEKLAALGALVAGVAHELNTPIGNSLMIASTLQEESGHFADQVAEQKLRRSDLSHYVAHTLEACTLIMRSLQSAASLVSSFKQVAVDQASAQKRRFNLAQVCTENVATMMSQVRKNGHTLIMEIPPDIEMDSYPGPLGQVILNLMSNALLHGFDGRRGGTMRLSASALGKERVRIVFHDDGKGIPAEHLARIFDPFFTTRLGQGGNGLGLHISYNIVSSVLGGQIQVASSAAGGTSFTLDLPLCPAPQECTNV